MRVWEGALKSFIDLGTGAEASEASHSDPFGQLGSGALSWVVRRELALTLPASWPKNPA